MRRGAGWVAASVLAGLAWGATAVQAACGEALAGGARQQMNSGSLQVAFAPSVWPVPVGEFFSLEVMVCEPSGPNSPQLMAVDATMPAHRHGMNYRPRVQPLGDGRFSVQGLLFHMPGRWRLDFELGQGAQARHLSHEVDVP